MIWGVNFYILLHKKDTRTTLLPVPNLLIYAGTSKVSNITLEHTDKIVALPQLLINTNQGDDNNTSKITDKHNYIHKK